MKGLRNRFERFCYAHRFWGIPNLMLYIVLASGVVSIMQIMGYDQIYNVLCFDRALILQGQVWRLFTYVFTQSSAGLLELLFLYFFYMLGRHVEMRMGTLRFNLYYLTGVVLMDIFAMLFADEYTAILYMDMAYYLHLSLIFAFLLLLFLLLLM